MYGLPESLTLIQQSYMSSYHIICYNKKKQLNKLVYIKEIINIISKRSRDSSDKSCEMSYLYVVIANGIATELYMLQ